MVITLVAQLAVTPAGKPVAAPMPVAPVVVWVIGGIAVLTHKVGVDEAALTVSAGVTVNLWQELKKYKTTNIKMDFNTIGFIS